jgi:hypothetical protein
MKNLSFKTQVGLGFVISHFLILILILVCKFMGGFSFDELTTTIGLVIPLFATYTSSIIKDIVKNAQVTATIENSYSAPFRFITLFLIGLFFAYLVLIIILKAFNYGFENFEQFKILLGLSEAIFGAYIAQIIFSMYDHISTKSSEKPDQNH